MDAPDYTYYSATYGGAMSEGAFNAAIRRAIPTVTNMVGRWASITDADQIAACKTACCMAADAYDAAPSDGVSSEGIGGASTSWRSDFDADDSARSAVRETLLAAGLLYTGLM